MWQRGGESECECEEDYLIVWCEGEASGRMMGACVAVISVLVRTAVFYSPDQSWDYESV